GAARLHRLLLLGSPRRGEDPSLSLAVLAHAAARGAPRHLRPLVLRAGAGGARRGLLLGRGVAPRLPRDQRVRGAPGLVRDGRAEVLAAPLQGGAAPALPDAGARPFPLAQADGGGLAQPRAVGRIRTR